MTWCYNISTRRTVDFECIAIKIYVTWIVDEVNGTLNLGITDEVTIVGCRGGNPCILIREQCYLVHSDTVTASIESQCLRTSLFLMSPDIFHREVFNEDVVRVDDYRCAYAHVYGIVATAQTIVLDDNLVAVLSDEVDIWLCLRNINMFLVFAILDEDEPRSSAANRSGINGFLNRLVVACSVLCYNGIINLRLRLLALHGSEVDGCTSNLVATTTEQYAFRHGKCVIRSIFQTSILEDGCLSADNRSDFLTIKRSVAFTSFHLLVECQDDRTIGTNATCTVFGIAWYEDSFFIG